MRSTLTAPEANSTALKPDERAGKYLTFMIGKEEFGVGVLIRRVIERVKARNGVLHVSFDVDFLDPQVAPGVGTTVPGGATYREAHLIMELLHDSGLVRSVDIVELNPFLDERGRTARVAVELLGSLFGLQITDRQTPSNAVLPDGS